MNGTNELTNFQPVENSSAAVRGVNRYTIEKSIVRNHFD